MATTMMHGRNLFQRMLLLVVGFLWMPSADCYFPLLVRRTAQPELRLPLHMTSRYDDSSSSAKTKSADSEKNLSSLLELNRRETLAGTAAMASLPWLREAVVSGEVFTWTTTTATAGVVPEALLQGDAIVRNLWLNRLAYPVLVVALEAGLFEALQRKALTKDELGRRMTPPVQGTGRVLEAMVAVLASLDLVHVQEKGHFQKVSLTAAARHVLLQDSPYFWGPQLLAGDGLTSALRRAVQTENKPPKSYSGHSTASIDSFIDSMQAHGSVTAVATAQALDSVIGVSAIVPAKHILDMAGGSGCFATALSAQSRNKIQVTLADLPSVVARWRHQQRPFLASSRGSVHAVPADLFHAETWPIGPDCHLMANVLHDWGTSQVVEILRASRDALAKSTSNGRLVVIEQLLDSNRTGPLPAALASISMLLGDWRTGKQYSYAELEALAKQAGFSRVKLGPPCGSFHTAVIAHV